VLDKKSAKATGDRWECVLLCAESWTQKTCPGYTCYLLWAS